MARRSRKRRHSPSSANPRSFGELRSQRGEQDQILISSAQAQTGPANEERAPQPAPSLPGKDQADWKVEYSRVFSDLKQLLIVSAALFILMLVVGLFL